MLVVIAPKNTPMIIERTPDSINSMPTIFGFPDLRGGQHGCGWGAYHPPQGW
jgi:hypothetical protein